MNKSKLKSYAPAARREFIQAVTDRAHFYGLSENKNETQHVEEKGDVAIIGGRAFPRKIAAQRKNLEQRIEREGFAQVMEAVAYTWFNRFLALRYMEIHGYLEHGFRVLSNPSGSTIPEILEQAAHIQLPGLDQKKAVELKLDGSKDAELYRMILVAQCNALNTAMPFLFERIDDETELLLPDNLLHSDSLIRKLVTEIDEEDWQQVEIIGWLYQFYISEKKDQVIGKVVKPEDIPAATQLFTPNWIVKYMVQNSLGRMWLATYPNSAIKGKMEYYIEPAEQTDEVKAQLAAITPKELNPETITLLDPASGSGHILVEAYDLFKEIYLERGYRSRDIPRLILEKNLFGLDIDDRAAQMAGFALLMKARADDRRILKENSPRLNVMAIQETGVRGEGLGESWDMISEAVIARSDSDEAISKDDIKDLLELFKQGKNFGSLIQIPEKIAGKLKALANLVESHINSPDIFTQNAAASILPFVRQAMILARQYDCVVANPPYMGSKGMNPMLKDYAKVNFPDSKSDLFSMFIERGFGWCGFSGFNSMVTMQSWMFLSSFELMREKLLTIRTIVTMAHLGARAFSEISGEVVQTTAFILQGVHITGYRPTFFRLVDGQEEQKKIALYSGQNRFDTTVQDDFQKIPGSPVAYWLSNRALDNFETGTPLKGYADAKSGMSSGNSDMFLRVWHEIDISLSFFSALNHEEARTSGQKWFPYNKGGGYRKWYGFNDVLLNWANDGSALKEFVVNNPNDPNTTHWSRRLFNLDYFFKPGVTWPAVASAAFSTRIVEEGVIPGTGSKSIYLSNDLKKKVILGILNSCVADFYLAVLSPTLNYEAGDVGKLPILWPNIDDEQRITKNVADLIDISRTDWNSLETSWDFQYFPWLSAPLKASTLEPSWQNWQAHCTSQIARMRELETQNNRIFIEAYGLQDELTPEVSEDQITLARADRESDIKRLISYAVGCMMGRYSLDKPGLIYANSGSIGFDSSKYKSFPADDDGIIPVMDMDWFEDDAASRFEEFLKVAWPDPSPQPSPSRGEGVLLEENMKFVADSLSSKAGETPRETIRRYFSTQFYKDHMQTYKKRPIYWLFSSGRQRAFECLVYLHRYNEATLSRMRNEYVTPLQGKFSARSEYLSNEVNAAASTSVRTKLQKQLDTLKKKQVELAAFDDLLRHYADKRIPLDLDDGVKVNYGKFGNLLAEVKAITGGVEE